MPHNCSAVGALARLALLAVVVIASACRWGTTPAKLNRLVGASGAEVIIHFPAPQPSLSAELYAVEPAGVLMKASLLTRVDWTSMRSMDVVGFGTGYDMRAGSGMSDEQRERLRLISRFPQGLSGPLLTRVLETLGQDSVRGLATTR